MDTKLFEILNEIFEAIDCYCPKCLLG
ncbi:colicin immunity domain-containing protein [Schinkia azotoformans]